MSDISKDNAGAKRLRELHPGRGGAAKVAKAIDADPSAVSRWFSGDRRPDLKMRAALESAYQISWRLWDEPAAVASAAVASEPAA